MLSRRLSWLVTLAVLLAPGIAAACPTCAVDRNPPATFWLLLGSFIALPLVLSALVYRVLRAHLCVNRPEDRLAESSSSSPRSPLRSV